MPDAPRPLPPKKEVALALLEREPSVFVHLDPRRPGVHVPKWLAKQPQLTLQIGMNMSIPIPDLTVDDEGISCTLSFQRTPVWCRMPWPAVWAIVGESQRGMVWPEDMPPEVVAQQQKAASAARKPAQRPRPRLAAVGPGGAVEDSAAEASAAEATSAEAAGGDREAAAPAAEAGAAEAEVAEAVVAAKSEPAAEAAEAVVAARPEPAAEAAEPAAAEPAATREAELAETDPVGDAAGEGAKPPARPAGGKPKRELPPYLRVIK